MSAVCATPPHLEGATLQEIPLESLNCDGNVNSKNNRNVLQQLELRSKENNLTFENKFSDDVSNIAPFVIESKFHIEGNLTIVFSLSLLFADHFEKYPYINGLWPNTNMECDVG